MGVEDIALTNPEEIFKIYVNYKDGLDIDQLLKAAT